MLILVSYDVNTTTSAGRKRLRQVAKICCAYGQRVQNSVFECVIDATQAKFLEASLLRTMDQEHDSVRMYTLGNQYENKVKHYGVKTSYKAEGLLIL